MKKRNREIRILLVEDDQGDALLIEELLTKTRKKSNRSARFRIERVTHLAQGLDRLTEKSFDVAVIDLSLPDSQGIVSLEEMRSHAPHIPIVVLTGMNDEELAVTAVEKGAQDYIIKSELVGNILVSCPPITLN